MRLGFGPQDWDSGLKAGIWASRLRYGPGGGGGMEKEKEEKEGEEEKIPPCESIGHRPLRGRCPKKHELSHKVSLTNSFMAPGPFVRLGEMQKIGG